MVEAAGVEPPFLHDSQQSTSTLNNILTTTGFPGNGNAGFFWFCPPYPTRHFETHHRIPFQRKGLFGDLRKRVDLAGYSGPPDVRENRTGTSGNVGRRGPAGLFNKVFLCQGIFLQNRGTRLAGFFRALPGSVLPLSTVSGLLYGQQYPVRIQKGGKPFIELIFLEMKPGIR